MFGVPAIERVRGDLHDAAVAGLAHRRLDRARDEVGAVEVDRHDLAPVGEVDVVPGDERDDRGGVDEHVDLAVAGERLLEPCAPRPVSLEMSAVIASPSSRAAAAAAPSPLRSATAMVGALGVELVGDRPADTLRGAGDDRHPSLELHALSSSPC